MGTNGSITLLIIGIGIVFLILIIMIVMYIYISKKKDDDDSEKEMLLDTKTPTERPKENLGLNEFGRFQGVLSIESMHDFMEFDEVVDNMIVRKNHSQYVMVIQCNGVNYDLMSADEKMGVEEGFVQFLNTLRFSVQLYVQSRTLNLKNIIDTYKARVAIVTDDLKKLDQRIKQVRATGNKPMLERLEFERRRKTSVLEYGQNITEYVERLSSNKNILQQKTYVVLSYYTVEIGGNVENYSVEELNNICFSELYTRAQNVISSLSTSQVTGRILNSEELAELLFVAYNRDDSEIHNIGRMLDAQYDALYSSGKDVLEKRKEKLDEEISLAAIDLTTDSILRADRKKQEEERAKERDRNQRIKEKALNLLNQYEDQLDPRVFEVATEEIEKAKIGENNPEPKQEQTSKQTIDKPVSNFSARRIIRKKPTTKEGGV